MNGGELARPLIKFREIAREEGLDCDLGMEEMLSCVRLPILRQAIDELASEKDDQEKYGHKLGMNNILTRTIKSMKGMYAKPWKTRRRQSSTVSTTLTNSVPMSCLPQLAIELSPSL